MFGIRVVCLIILTCGLLFSGMACSKNKSAQKASDATRAERDEATARRSRLQGAVDELNATVRLLPSGNDQQDQRNIGRGLGQISTALRLMSEDETGGFELQIAGIERSADMLSHGTSDRDPEPVINSGFWSAMNAIDRVARRFNDEKTNELLAQLDAKVRELDTIRGPLHRLVASEALRSASQTITHMAQLVEQTGAQTATVADAPE